MSSLYKCRVCHGTFKRETMKGRKPVACPEHRRAAKRRVDRRKKRENYARGGAARRPPCCVEHGNTQCPQHRQWTTFQYQWKRMIAHPESVEAISDLAENSQGGFSITSL